jgi:uncharacterized cupin superfamily protein
MGAPSYIGEEKTVGTVHWLSHSEPDEPFFVIGLWKYIPEGHSNNKFYFRFGNNDTMFYVLKGEAEFCTSDGKTSSIRKRNKFFLPKDSEGEWKIVEYFTTLFIQTDRPDNWSFPIMKLAEIITRLK